MIVGSQNSVSAADQERNGVPYAFSSWSNGMAQNDVLIAPASNATFTATFHALGFSIPAQGDALVRKSSPSTNFGRLTQLWLRAGQSRAFLKFNVTGLSSRPSQAFLRLWVANSSGIGGHVYRTSNSWTEHGVTWNNEPATIGPSLDSLGAVSAGHWVEFDVTSAIAGNGLVSFRLQDGGADAVAYGSRESTHKPSLILIP